MAKLLCSTNQNHVKMLFSNSVIRTFLIDSMKTKSGTSSCKTCDILRRGLTTHMIQTLNPQKSQVCSRPYSRNLNREIKAFGTILSRSGFRSNEDIFRLLGLGCRSFSTSFIYRNHDDGNENENEKENKKRKDQMDAMFNNMFKVFFGLSIFFAILTVLQVRVTALDGNNTNNPNGSRYISWNEFYHEMMLKGEVLEIGIRPESEIAIIRLQDGAVVKGKKNEVSLYVLKIPYPYKFEEKIRQIEENLGIKPEDSIEITYQRASSWAKFISTCIILGGTLMLLRYLRTKISVNMKFPSADEMFFERKAKFTRVDILSQDGKGVTFKDVAGLKEAKIEINEFVDYLKSPDRFKELGAKIPRGAILLGPPGCGKTLLARAVATEAKVPFLAMGGSEFVEMVGGLGAARVRNLFTEAKKRAPCIVYIDEIDAVGKKRGGSGGFGGNSEMEQTLNQLLVEMDGMITNKGVLMLASTNRSDILDKALLRPGRFDRHITIDLPTMIERREIFDMYLEKLKLKNPAESISPRLAQLTPGMSGADIANVCNEAAIHAARDCKKVIEPEDFDYALERVIAGVPKKSGALAPAEKKIVAYHESGHALVGWLLKHTDALLKVSIVPRTNNTLGFSQYQPSDQHLYNKEELFERMCMALGGRVAEVVIFNKVTTGAQDDLLKVTQMAYDQIRSYGMNDLIGPISFPREGSQQIGSKPYSKRLSATIDEEAQVLIGKAFRKTEELLQKNKDKLHLLASTLLQREVLNYEDIEKIIGPPPFGKKKTIDLYGVPSINDLNLDDNNNDNTNTQNKES